MVGPEKMITIPPRHYCIIENQVIRGKDGKAELDENGQAKLAFADLEIRFNQDPFPLYPGENLKQVRKPKKCRN
jgi:major vault protein